MSERITAGIEFRAVHYRYGRRRGDVIVGVTWVPLPGCTVLLGPNGAGKSTLLRLGAGVLRPTRGEVHTAYKASWTSGGVGYMPQTVAAVRGLTAREQVAYTGWMQGMSRTRAWAAARVALGRVGLADQERTPAAQLSGGQLRRVGLAEAIVAGPGLLILDEPTVGLDPAERARFRGLLDQIAAASTAVIVSTHQVDDLGVQFARVAVMDAGQVTFVGTVGDFLVHGEPGSELHRAESAYAAVLQAGRR